MRSIVAIVFAMLSATAALASREMSINPGDEDTAQRALEIADEEAPARLASCSDEKMDKALYDRFDWQKVAAAALRSAAQTRPLDMARVNHWEHMMQLASNSYMETLGECISARFHLE